MQVASAYKDIYFAGPMKKKKTYMIAPETELISCAVWIELLLFIVM